MRGRLTAVHLGSIGRVPQQLKPTLLFWVRWLVLRRHNAASFFRGGVGFSLGKSAVLYACAQMFAAGRRSCDRMARYAIHGRTGVIAGGAASRFFYSTYSVSITSQSGIACAHRRYFPSCAGCCECAATVCVESGVLDVLSGNGVYGCSFHREKWELAHLTKLLKRVYLRVRSRTARKCARGAPLIRAFECS